MIENRPTRFRSSAMEGHAFVFSTVPYTVRQFCLEVGESLPRPRRRDKSSYRNFARAPSFSENLFPSLSRSFASALNVGRIPFGRDSLRKTTETMFPPGPALDFEIVHAPRYLIKFERSTGVQCRTLKNYLLYSVRARIFVLAENERALLLNHSKGLAFRFFSIHVSLATRGAGERGAKKKLDLSVRSPRNDFLTVFIPR